MKDCEGTGGWGGRPRRRLIEDPSGARAAGREKFLAAKRDYERHPFFDDKPRKPPMAPSDRWDEGLVYASRADLIAPQSVKALACEARKQRQKLRRLFRCHRGAAGPMRDADQAVRLWLANAFVRKVAHRQGVPTRKPGNADIRDALELLFEEELSEEAVKKRRQRLRRRLGDIRDIRQGR